MVRKRFQSFTLLGNLPAQLAARGAAPALCALVTILLAAAPGARASEYFGSVEDGQGSTGYENNGDFNDIIFDITGNVTMDAPGGVFNNLTPSVVNQNGTVFWDNPSGDGPNMNIGYCMLGEAACAPSGAISGTYQYLATPTGGSVNDITFDATGAVTLTVLGGITGNLGNTLGYYDLSDPGVLYELTAVPPSSSGETVTFTPDGAFALFETNGWGPMFSSVSASNVDESPDQQHFAFFIDPPSAVPEPSTGLLMGMGVALLGFGRMRRGKP